MKLATREEMYIMHEIREDYELQIKQSLVMSGVTKFFGAFKLAQSLAGSSSSLVFKFIALGSYMYFVDIKFLASLYSIPRLSYYLRLMQVGDHLRLGEDTL